MLKINASTRLAKSQVQPAKVQASLKGLKVKAIVEKIFQSPTFLGNSKEDIEDDQNVSSGMFATSTSQVDMEQLEKLKRAGVTPKGITASKSQPGKLIVSFTC